MLSRAPLLWTTCPAALEYAFLREGFDIVMYPKTLDPTSPSTRVLALLHVLWPQSLPHHLGGLWYCHTSLGTELRLSAYEGSGTNTRPLAPDRTPP
jgi:hypothetical protein